MPQQAQLPAVNEILKILEAATIKVEEWFDVDAYLVANEVNETVLTA